MITSHKPEKKKHPWAGMTDGMGCRPPAACCATVCCTRCYVSGLLAVAEALPRIFIYIEAWPAVEGDGTLSGHWKCCMMSKQHVVHQIRVSS